MENKIFVPVKAKDRLPPETGYYHAVDEHGSKNLLWFDYETGFCERVDYWLEEKVNQSAEVLQLLKWLDRKGGLGFDVHEKIEKLINSIEKGDT